MKQFDLQGKGTKLIHQGNILAVLSDCPLKIIGSAFHNGGGIKESRVILNIEVPKDYGDINLHMDPEALIVASARKLDLKDDFMAMITAASVENFALVSKLQDDIGVSVIATAADKTGHTCDRAESAGEEINVKVEEGTINVIVVIDGNPTDSCLVSSIITATEAKTAAMLELDIRSRYSGAAATGTITDALVVAETGCGNPILFGGPASKLGQLIGFCTKQAVKEAIMKGHECSPRRSLLDRLAARHLPIERLAEELAKVKSFKTDKEKLAGILSEMIEERPIFASMVLAAVKLDEERQYGLFAPELGDIEAVGKKFGEMVSKDGKNCKSVTITCSQEELARVDLPVFLKQALIATLANEFSDA